MRKSRDKMKEFSKTDESQKCTNKKKQFQSRIIIYAHLDTI